MCIHVLKIRHSEGQMLHLLIAIRISLYLVFFLLYVTIRIVVLFFLLQLYTMIGITIYYEPYVCVVCVLMAEI